MTTVSFEVGERSRARYEARLQAALDIAFHRLRGRLVNTLAGQRKIPLSFWEHEEETLVRTLTPMLKDGLRLGVAAEQTYYLAQGADVNMQPHMQRTAAHLAQAVARQVIDTLAVRVDALLALWRESNKPIEAFDDALQTSVLSRSYAEMIAATETTRAITSGQLLVWRAMRPPAKYAPAVTPPDAPAFVVGKRWLVQRGQQVCPVCEPLDGMVVALDEKFERAGLSVDAPPAHPRCRCSLQPVWSNEVFRKPAGQAEAEPVTQLQNFPQQYQDWLAQAASLQEQLASLNQLRDRIVARLASGEATSLLLNELERINVLITTQERELAAVHDRLAGAVEEYAGLAEAVFGYDIVFHEQFSGDDQQRINMLTNLVTSNLAIVNYFDFILAGSPLTGLGVFSQYFSEVSVGAPIMIELGSEVNPEVDVPINEGWTPQPTSVDDPVRLQTIYLGSQITTATITHEFFHQLDRYFGEALSTRGNSLSFPDYLSYVVRNRREQAQGYTISRAFINENSGASTDPDEDEIFPDLAMTAVLELYGGVYFARSDNSGGQIGFRDTDNARDVECALRQYFFQILTGRTELTYDVATAVAQCP